jgi:ribosomal protein L7/L12
MIISENIKREIEILLSENRKVEAIKLVMDTTHIHLKEAKDFIDNYKTANVSTSNEAAPRRDIDTEILKLLANGNKLAAVKLYKDATGLGLADSKDYVDQLHERGYAPMADPLVFPSWSSSSKKRDTQIDELVSDQKAKPKSGCFVATVCYGDYDAPEVLVLRQFRDSRLMPSLMGKAFVKFYYAVSPFVAKQIDKSSGLKRCIRKYILTPIVKHLSK